MQQLTTPKPKLLKLKNKEEAKRAVNHFVSVGTPFTFETINGIFYIEVSADANLDALDYHVKGINYTLSDRVHVIERKK